MVPPKKPWAQFGTAYRNVMHWEVFSMKLVFRDTLSEMKTHGGELEECPPAQEAAAIFQCFNNCGLKKINLKGRGVQLKYFNSLMPSVLPQWLYISKLNLRKTACYPSSEVC